MLGFWRTHSDYQAFIRTQFACLAQTDPDRILEFDSALAKLFLLDLDLLLIPFPLPADLLFFNLRFFVLFFNAPPWLFFASLDSKA